MAMRRFIECAIGFFCLLIVVLAAGALSLQIYAVVNEHAAVVPNGCAKGSVTP